MITEIEGDHLLAAARIASSLEDRMKAHALSALMTFLAIAAASGGLGCNDTLPIGEYPGDAAPGAVHPGTDSGPSSEAGPAAEAGPPSDAAACTIPTNADTLDAGEGCTASPSYPSCTGSTCGDLCSATEYYLECVIPQAADSSGPPAPDPSLGCQLAGFGQPPNSQQYCCPCGQ